MTDFRLPPWFANLYRKLLVVDIGEQLPGKALDELPNITDQEAQKLIGVASALAFEDSQEARSTAYEIASRLVEIFGEDSPSIVAAADIVLSRLGNFPGRKLLRQRYCRTQGAAPWAPARLALERLTREMENSVPGPSSDAVTLTDFQYTLYDKLNNFSSVSVSAPTSAGKSFVLGLDLVRRLKKTCPACVVYVVPTRALIREVTCEIREHLRQADMESVPVRSVPFPIDIREAPRGAVYILTQERLMSFLHSSQGKPLVTALVVDEAQSIRDEARGVILQSAIEAVLTRFPNAEIHFASPLAKNPEFLLEMIQRPTKDCSYIETVSPVSQNLLLVSEVYRRKSQAEFVLLTNQENIQLGKRELGFVFRDSKYKQRAMLARVVTRDDEATILFANDPGDTEELAEALTSELPLPLLDSIEPDIRELIEYIRSEVHAEYPLIKCLPYGVAYHYGSMPSIIRARVEDLFKLGKLKFVACTSTLLQGVNLPAKHIVIENPKRGRSVPMHRREFLNLAGRAGRLLREFHGNVWCIRPTEWEEKCYEGDRLQKIDSAMDAIMADGGTVIQRVLSNEAKDRDIEYGEAAIGKLYCDFIRAQRDLLDSPWKTNDNIMELTRTKEMLQSIKVSLPTEILDANRGVRPDRLQALYDYLNSVADPMEWVPLRPLMPGSNDRMGTIIKLVNEKLADIQNESYKYQKQLAVKWIHNTTLRMIIESHIQYMRQNGSHLSISRMIRDLLGDLEYQIRFQLVKYYMAYVSVLTLVLRQKNFINDGDALEPFHVYLECGASDRVVLNLIALGLSRSTALALRGKIQFPEDASPEICLAKLASTNLAKMAIPRLCVREIQDLLGR